MKIKKFLAASLAFGLTTTLSAGPKLDSCGYQMSQANDSNNKGPYQFDEDDFMKAIYLVPAANISVPNGIGVLYNDETPVMLGITRGFTKTGPTTTPDQAPVLVSPIPNNHAVANPALGINGSLAAAPDGYDDEGRPSWPVIYVTDQTGGTSNAGDFQNGGTPISPSAIYGTWNEGEKLNQSNNSSFTSAVFPAPNTGYAFIPDTPVGGFASYGDEGYSAEVVFPIDSLTPGHTYRVQAIFHDSDSKRQGGINYGGGGVGGGVSFGGFGLGDRGGILDVGETCSLVTIPSTNACAGVNAVSSNDGGNSFFLVTLTGSSLASCVCPAGTVDAGSPPAGNGGAYPGFPGFAGSSFPAAPGQTINPNTMYYACSIANG